MCSIHWWYEKSWCFIHSTRFKYRLKWKLNGDEKATKLLLKGYRIVISKKGANLDHVLPHCSWGWSVTIKIIIYSIITVIYGEVKRELYKIRFRFRKGWNKFSPFERILIQEVLHKIQKRFAQNIDIFRNISVEIGWVRSYFLVIERKEAQRFR